MVIFGVLIPSDQSFQGTSKLFGWDGWLVCKALTSALVCWSLAIKWAHTSRVVRWFSLMPQWFSPGPSHVYLPPENFKHFRFSGCGVKMNWNLSSQFPMWFISWRWKMKDIFLTTIQQSLFTLYFFLSNCQDAIDWLCDQPYVKSGGIGIVGISAGATLALQTSALFPEKVLEN